ncbi:MAG: hypothetical protein RSC01_05360 [Oscillospiraceae bacterium]
MQPTSPAYKREMAKAIRGQALVRIKMGVIDTDAAPTSIPQDNGHIYFSDISAPLRDNAIPIKVYGTFETNRIRLDGTQLVVPRKGEKMLVEGFVSAEISDADGRYINAPQISFTSTKKNTVPALSFIFDTVTDDYPTELKISAYRGETQLLSKTYMPTSADWNTGEPIENFDKVVIDFLASNKPYRRARLQKITFGIGVVFSAREVYSCAQKSDIDPISRRLPLETFDFTLVNFNAIPPGTGQYMYDPDKPNGIWKYMEQHAPISLEYARELTSGLGWEDIYADGDGWAALEYERWREIYEGGTTEWINGGRYRLTSKPTVNGDKATFKAEGLLPSLTNTYYKGTYNAAGATLYDLAVSVLKDAALPMLVDDVYYRLWEGLKLIKTTTPMPIKMHKECLQLIAHAAQCVLYTDRNGYIQLQPAPIIKQDFALDFKTSQTKPKVTKIPTLKGVTCNVYSYGAEAARSEIYKGTHYVSAGGSIHITYESAIDVQVTINIGSITGQRIYAAAADFTVSTGGNIEFVVTGLKLVKSASRVGIEVLNADEDGAIEALDNPLVTDTSTALSVAAWVRDYLVLRNTYEMDIRGSPELEALDIVSAQSQFTQEFSARILKTEINYSSGLSGKVALKRLEE